MVVFGKVGSESVNEIVFKCRHFAAILAIAPLLLAGCGSGEYFPVSGRVVDTEGQVIEGLEDAQIEFESTEGKTSSVGIIQPDGTFSLYTQKPGDGALPGRHRILIARKYLDPERAVPRSIDPKYERFETSGLEVDLEKKDNKLADFKLTRYKRMAGEVDESKQTNR